jgi:GNAT superfamily N-acetyltransferase
MAVMEAWHPERLTELADLWNEAAPGEPLVEDELEACWRPGSTVIGDAHGVVVAHPAGSTVSLDLLAVRPEARRRGVGTRLVSSAIEAVGGDRVQWGASVPWYLWPGIESTRTEALALAEAMGFEHRSPAIQNMTVDTHWQVGHVPSAGLTARRADPRTARPMLDLVDQEYPAWVDELTRAVDHGTAHVVFDETSSDGTAPLGVGAHSVNRLGWIGPMATFAAGRGRGVGTEALAAVCADLASAGYTAAEIAWVGPIRFYAKVSGATTGRTYLPLSKRLRPPASGL